MPFSAALLANPAAGGTFDAIDGFLDTNVGDLVAGGVVGGINGSAQAKAEENRLKAEEEIARKRRQQEYLRMIQQQFQNNFNNTTQLASQIQTQFGGRGGFG